MQIAEFGVRNESAFRTPHSAIKREMQNGK